MQQKYDLYSFIELLETKDHREGSDRTLPNLLRSYLDDSNKKRLSLFLNRVEHVKNELGVFAAEYYYNRSAKLFKEAMWENGERLIWDDPNNEHDSLMEILCQSHAYQFFPEFQSDESSRRSPKFECLLDTLIENASSTFCGLIFVEQKATVVALSHLISTDHRCDYLFRCATFVGMSDKAKKRLDLGDILGPEGQEHTLDDFRGGKTNLLITTNALEEGIDIPSCNIVISFNQPQNLRSFIQRRGRARATKSKFYVMISETEQASKINSWLEVEQEMKRAYEDDQRKLLNIRELEGVKENSIEKFIVESTGATIFLEDAFVRLSRFCDALPNYPYMDRQPLYSIDRDEETHLLQARIRLPACIDPSIRQAPGLHKWLTERMARNDAAYRCFLNLYDNGMVDDHLRPILEKEIQANLDHPSHMMVSEQYNPWIEVATGWASDHMLHQYTVTVNHSNGGNFSLRFVVPFKIATNIGPDASQNMRPSDKLCIGHVKWVGEYSKPQVEVGKLTTSVVLSLIFDKDIPPDIGFQMLMIPYTNEDDLVEWAIAHSKAQHNSTNTMSFLSHTASKNAFQHEASQSALQRASNLATSSIVKDSEVSLVYSLLIRRIELSLVAQKLCNRMSPSVQYQYFDMFMFAIDAESPGKTTAHNLKLLGSIVIKYLVTRQLFVNHTKWTQGALSKQKTLIVYNYRLAEAAKASGLTQFFVTKSYGASIERIHKTDQIGQAQGSCAQREMGVRELANTVQRIIGAAYLSDGASNAISCARFFLSEIKQWPTAAIFDDTFAASRPVCPNNANLQAVEQLINHTFSDKSLLIEALTHPSCEWTTTICSYEKLAFLGDAVLELVLIDSLSEEDRHKSAHRIHLAKVAATNASYLGYICMEFADPALNTSNGTLSDNTKSIFTSTKRDRLWSFIRHECRDIPSARNLSLKRFDTVAGTIKHELQSTKAKYPWKELALLDPEKFLSDIIQSVFGAIFTDTKGDYGRCRSFAERIQVLDHFQRCVRSDMELRHPKSILSEMLPSRNLKYHHERSETPDGQSFCCISIDDIECIKIAENGSKEYLEIVAAISAEDKLRKDKQVKPALYQKSHVYRTPKVYK